MKSHRSEILFKRYRPFLLQSIAQLIVQAFRFLFFFCTAVILATALSSRIDKG